jgi:AbrB family looped-hinge helix DNA binding protein
MEISTVTSKGQVTIPIQIRKQLGINTKDKVIINIENSVITVKKLEVK